MTNIAELNALRARIDQLEAEAASEHAERDEQRTTRRGMLRWASAAAVGGVVATIAADPVAATDGSAVLAGVSVNTATLPTGIAVTAASGAVYGLGCYEAALGALNADLGRPAVFGHATNTAFNVGVAGHNQGIDGTGVLGLDTSADASGAGVQGMSTSGHGIEGISGGIGVMGQGGGYGVYAYASAGEGLAARGLRGAVRLDPFADEAPPARLATFFHARTLEADALGNVWYCYEEGAPGKWRKLAGPGTGGAFHPITPTRVYDSRAAAPSPGLLAAGNNRLVSVADGRDNNGTINAANIVAGGATAVAANITITGTTGGFGYLSINPGGNTVEGASTINWSAAGLTIANGVTLTLNASRQLTVICGGGAGASTHFIVDIAGYYL